MSSDSLWSLDQKLKWLTINPTIRRKIDNREYEKLTKKEWNDIFRNIDEDIQYYLDEGDTFTVSWYKDLYSETEHLMKEYHPDWSPPTTVERNRLRYYKDSPCNPGEIWVPLYYKKDGQRVRGYCRKNRSNAEIPTYTYRRR